MRRLILSSKLWASEGGGAPSRGRERQSAGLRRTFALRRVAGALALGMILGAGLWIVQSGFAAHQTMRLGAAMQQTGAQAGLAVSEVYVRGRDLTRVSDLRAAMGITRGTPIMAVDPATARQRIEALTWVAEAAVSRDLPDTIRIDLREHRPLALWQHRGRVQVINHDGEPVPGAAAGRFDDLPLVVGKGAPAHTRQILNILRSQPALAKRVQAAVRVSGRRWNVRLGNGVDVQLPDSGTRRAWARLARLETRHGLLQRDIRSVDLRLPDKLMVRLAPGAKPFEAGLGPGTQT